MSSRAGDLAPTAMGNEPFGSFSCCGVRINAYPLEAAVDLVLERAHRRTGGVIHLCNAYVLSLAYRDPSYAEILDRGDANFADGMPVVWAARRLGFDHLHRRTSGPDLFLATVQQGVQRRTAHYLYGSTPEVVQSLALRLRELGDGASIVGVESPPFRSLTDEELEQLVERVRESGAHVVWIGLGTPRQDELIERLRHRVPAVLVPVGAAFDFIGGRRGRAPAWMQRTGLEWVYRLLSEPRRLLRRYLVGNLIFLWGVLRTSHVVVPPDAAEIAERARTRAPHRLRVTLGGAEVDLMSRSDVIATVGRALEGEGDSSVFVTGADTEHIHRFGFDSGYEGAFEEEDGFRWVVLPADRAVVRTARRLTGNDWGSVAPVGFLPDALQLAAARRARVGFLGGTQGDVARFRSYVADRFPGARLDMATHVPPDEVLDRLSDIAHETAEHGLDLLVVSLPKPHQEMFLLSRGRDLAVRVALAVGELPPDLADLESLDFSKPRRTWRRFRHLPPALVRLRRYSRVGTDPARRQMAPAPVLSTPTHWRQRVGKILVLADASVIAVSSLLAYVVRARLGEAGVIGPLKTELPLALGVLPFWLVVCYLFGCYRPEYLVSTGELVRRFFSASAVGLLAVGFMSFAIKADITRGYVALFVVFVVMGGTAARLGTRAYLAANRRRGRFRQRVLVVGTDDESLAVVDAMRRTPAAGYEVVGFLDDEVALDTDVVDGLRVLGRPDDVLQVAYRRRAGLVVVSPTGVRPGTLRDLTVTLEGSPVDLCVAPSLFQVVSRRVTVESVDNVPLLHIDQVRLEGGRAVAKRLFDIATASFLLLVLAPVMVGAALAVRLDSVGPTIFRQIRIGKDGAPFTMLKFRTMVADAEERLGELSQLNEAGHRFFKIREDPRVTRVGRFLRKWSIDETPQLINVLRGQMSMVGPRPPVPAEVEKYEPWHWRRLRVRPGLSGVWQVSGRSNVPFDEAVRMDIFYIENWSLSYDIVLLGKTASAVLGRRGAY